MNDQLKKQIRKQFKAILVALRTAKKNNLKWADTSSLSMLKYTRGVVDGYRCLYRILKKEN